MQHVDVVVGGQYGSEAKGHVTAQLIQQNLRSADHQGLADFELWNVRVAGPNAGHTVYDSNGQKFAFRQLPVGAVVDPRVKLYIAPGSEVDLEVLLEEIDTAWEKGWNTHDRLYVSSEATLIERGHFDIERDQELTERIGSTGKGVGAARAERILRTARTLGQWFDSEGGGHVVPWTWAEPEDLYATDTIVHERKQMVIIEGTQGYGLSLRASGNYPHVTSSDCRSVDFLAMAGIDPTRCCVDIVNWVVCRVHPIRVAGNSGPLKGETTWEALRLEPEQTTVTHKIRRVGTWDLELVAAAIQANGGRNAKLVVTMLDQVIPELAELAKVYNMEPEENDDDVLEQHEPTMQKVIDWLDENAPLDKIGAQVGMVTFSPTHALFAEFTAERAERSTRPAQTIDEMLRTIVGVRLHEEGN